MHLGNKWNTFENKKNFQILYKNVQKTEHFLGQCLPYFKGTKSIELQTQKMLYLLSEWNLMARKMYAPDQRNKRKRQFWFEITECLLINVVGQQ